MTAWIDVEARVKELGLVLPAVPTPSGGYVPYQIMGNLIFLSGQDTTLVGKVGRDIDLPEAYQRARGAGILLLSVMRAAVGDLNNIAKVGKVLGMVNATPEFKDHPAVIDGCSDLFLDVFGERGRHARSSVGMSSLPGNTTVVIEAVAEFVNRT